MKDINVIDYFPKTVENANILKNHLVDWQKKYPASSFLNFFYLKVLRDNYNREFERKKGKLLLSIPNRKLFIESCLKYPLYDCVANFYTTSIADAKNQPQPQPPAPAPVEELPTISSLIEKFSVNPPKIIFNVDQHDSEANFAEESCKENDEIVTETLAIVYAQQGYTGKAEKILKKLSLQFPEKSVYFADLIKKLKSKENNQ